MSDVIYTVNEMCVRFKVPKSTIYKLANEGKLPAIKVGKHWRFPAERVELWLKG